MTRDLTIVALTLVAFACGFALRACVGMTDTEWRLRDVVVPAPSIPC